VSEAKTSNQPRNWNRYSSIVGISLLLATCGIAFWIGTSGLDSSPADSAIDPSTPSGPPWYRDVTLGSGLNFTYRNGEEANQFTILESLGGGIALLDYDGDGLLDVFVAGGGYFDGPDRNQIKGHPCKLYRNLGNFQFEDVTAKVGLDKVAWWYTHGAAIADYDRDGWPDLLVTGYGQIALFHNESDGAGGRRFVDVTEAVHLKDNSWSTSAGWADIDGDGFPDLYVCHYCDWSFANNPKCRDLRKGTVRDVCAPEQFKPLIHSLFKNEGGKGFRDVSSDHGFEAKGNGLGVVLLDVNDDGRPDIYVANDQTKKFLFLNRNGQLKEMGMLAGVAVDDSGRNNSSMGVDAGEFDGSGRPSLWVTNFQNELHALYQNLGDEHFRYVSEARGLATYGRHLVGFGTAFIDADNDGWEDLVIAHGHVLHYPPNDCPVMQLPMLLRNVDENGQRNYHDLGATAGPYFRIPTMGRGLAVGDLNNDGWPDFVISHNNTPVAVLRNVVAEHAPARWLGIRLVGRGNRDVVGSTVTLETGTRTLTRFAKGGGSYLAANDPRLLFGLGAEGKPGRVTVKWSWGETQTWDGLQDGAYWELREGVPTPTRVATPR
jgi:enediyne biosynthesis protein E4